MGVGGYPTLFIYMTVHQKIITTMDQNLTNVVVNNMTEIVSDIVADQIVHMHDFEKEEEKYEKEGTPTPTHTDQSESGQSTQGSEIEPPTSGIAIQISLEEYKRKLDEQQAE